MNKNKGSGIYCTTFFGSYLDINVLRYLGFVLVIWRHRINFVFIRISRFEQNSISFKIGIPCKHNGTENVMYKFEIVFREFGPMFCTLP